MLRPAVKPVVEVILAAEAHEQCQFYKCQWQTSPNLIRSYVLYRWMMAAIFSAVLIAAIIRDMGTTIGESLKFFIYLTHWGFILCTVQAVLGATLVSRKYREVTRLENDADRAQCLEKTSTLVNIYWIAYTMSVVSSFGITIIFWTRVYIPDYHEWGIMLFLLHGLNSFLMLLDVIVVAHPLKFVHFLWTFAFVLVYLLFSYLYHLAGGTNAQNSPFIYHSLNWERPNNALWFCVSSLIFGFCIHVCVWIFSAIIRRKSGAVRQTKNVPVPVLPIAFHTAQNHCINVISVAEKNEARA